MIEELPTHDEKSGQPIRENIEALINQCYRDALLVHEPTLSDVGKGMAVAYIHSKLDKILELRKLVES